MKKDLVIILLLFGCLAMGAENYFKNMELQARLEECENSQTLLLDSIKKTISYTKILQQIQMEKLQRGTMEDGQEEREQN